MEEKKVIEEEIQKLQSEVEFEERKALRKQDLFIQDLDDQVAEKKQVHKAKKAAESALTLKDVMVWEQKTRDKNELAAKLTKIATSDDFAVAVRFKSFKDSLPH